MMTQFLKYFAIFLVFQAVHSQTIIKVGGLFDYNIKESIKTLQFAVKTANEEILNEEEFKMQEEVSDTVYGNELITSKNLCTLLEQGVTAIFGPEDPPSSIHASNICDMTEIPYIDTRYDFDVHIPVVNLYPSPDSIAKLFVELVQTSGWKTFTILYETAPLIARMADLLKLYDPKGYTITVRRLDLGLPQNNYRPVLRQVKLSNEKSIIIESSIENLPEILKQAQQVGLMTDQHHFILTNFDAHTIDLEPFQYAGTNFTAARLVDPENETLQKFAEHLAEPEPTTAPTESPNEPAAEGESNGDDDANSETDGDGIAKTEKSETQEEEPFEFSPENIRLQTALIYDGILLLAETFKQLGMDEIQPVSISCQNESTWEKGISISNFMRNTVVKGLTGKMKFDTNGLRSDFTAQLYELNSHGTSVVGTWSPETGITITKEPPQSKDFIDDSSLRNQTFVVITALSPPYGMLKESSAELSGNDRFEGFGVDVIHELSLMLGFKYIFRLQDNGVYGSKNNVTKEWNGMIREVIDKRADLAITDLTITAERESGVDFTMPFMNLGISLLLKKPTKEPPSTFSFMSPFSAGVWFFLGIAYLSVSICLFILGRLSPSEWDNPYPCIEEPTQLENQFTFQNSMWFSIGALLQQGSEIAPKAPSTRFVAAIWWFFTLIMVSSYTANLAAFLTIESVKPVIKSVEDLKDCGVPGKSCPVEFGAKKGGATINFFKEAEHITYRNMYNYMTEHPELLTTNNEQGVLWAVKKNYVYLMESSSIEYIVERNCDVTQLGNPLDEKGYGIAMRKNSNYRNALSEGILKMQEQGKLSVLKIKWWKEKKGGGACSDSAADSAAVALEMANVEGIFYLLGLGVIVAVLCAFFDVILETRKQCQENKEKDSNEAAELGMPNLKGVFLVLLLGSIVATLYGVVEWFINCCKSSKYAKVPFKEEFLAELKFIMKCKGNTKVVRHRKSESTDSRHSVISFRSNRSAQSHDASEMDHHLRSDQSNLTLRHKDRN